MNITISDLIATGSALVAGLSALYARWAGKAAKHQNEISIHGARLAVYKGITSFGSKLTAHGCSIDEAEVWSFGDWVSLSEFYFNASIYQRLEAAFKKSLDMLTKNDEWLHSKNEGNSNHSELNDQRYTICRGLRDECFSIADTMKEFLLLAQP